MSDSSTFDVYKKFSFRERSECPACLSTDTSDMYDIRFDQGWMSKYITTYYKINPSMLEESSYHLGNCRSCSLIFQKYIGDSSSLFELYTQWIEEPDDPETAFASYRDDICAPRLSRDAHEIMAASSYLTIPLDRMRTLDYGTGWALWPRISAQLGCLSFGADLSTSRQDFARQHGVRVVSDDEIPEHQFDFINAEQVFEHVPDPLALATRLSEALAPSGILKISVPSGEGVERVIARLDTMDRIVQPRDIMAIHPLEHINCFKRKSLERLAEKCGLSPVRPNYRHRFAFLRHSGTIDLFRPRKTIKELVRPWHQYHSSTNLHVWMQKQS